MPTAIPTLGYRSQREAIYALRKDGLRTTEIAKRIGGLHARRVSAVLQRDFRKTVNVPRDVMEALEPHARRRGIKATRLAMLIISAAVDDGLIDALLVEA